MSTTSTMSTMRSRGWTPACLAALAGLVIAAGACDLRSPTEPPPPPQGDAVEWVTRLGTMTVFPQGRTDFVGAPCDPDNPFTADPWCRALGDALALALAECALSDREQQALRVDGTRLVITSALARGEYDAGRDEIRAGSPEELGRQVLRKWGLLDCAVGRSTLGVGHAG